MFTINLELNVPSFLEACTDISGLRVEVQENSTQVVVRNVDAADADEAFKKALNAANYFLNTLSWKHNTDLKIETEASSVELMESSELSLLRLGLDECFANNLHPLIEATKRIYTFDNNQSLVPQVAEMLYKGHRCELNHSKASEDKKIPFSLQDEEEVKTALPLMDLIAISLLGYEETSL